MAQINLLDKLPKANRNIQKRVHERSIKDYDIAKKFGREYFDGERRFGYGGYYYDGRWLPVAKKLIKHYNLAPDSRILEIGCAKGFLLHDIQKLLPKSTVRGIDISEYARENAYGTMKEKIDLGNAHRLPYEDDSFDLVIAINTIHNLPLKQCIEAIREIERVSRSAKYISVDAWKNDVEKQRILDWALTARTCMHAQAWQEAFEETEYTGDYWFSVP